MPANLLTRLINPNEREVRQHLRTAQQITELEPELKGLTDAELAERSAELRERAGEAEDLGDLLVPSFALTRELSRRVLGMRHFDVQLVGGIVLHEGKISEMKTGEGKTLVASLPLALNALGGKGAHLVTVNDYLARRDAGWMAPLYHALGLSVGVIHSPTPQLPDGSYVYDPDYLDESHQDERLRHLRPTTRREAYLCDITYGTNNEFGFDYLRDNMATEASQQVQRELQYAIVDEVDSILIDEARTPLIISGQGEDSTDKYRQYARLAARLTGETDFTVDEKHKSVSLTEVGISKVERWTGITNIYDLENVIEAHQVNQAMRAKALYLRERDYLVVNGEAVIVDEFTGRTMPGRRWSDGLHQAVEAKEGLKVQQEMKTLATITLQNYFRLYEKLAGMTGTALTEAEELHKIYQLDVVEIPTHRPMRRDDQGDVIYKTVLSKFEAVIDEVEEMAALGRPVLVGTVSVEKSELLAKMLGKRGVPHSVLNAKQHEREAAIVSGAGERGAVTIATNMAGRGTDIVLGEGIANLGGLHIIGTERHESRRIDNQLRGRSGRQGDPGSTRFFLSLEDDLMRVFGPAADRIGRLMDRLEVEPIEHKWVANSIEGAQKKVEGMHFDDRKHVVEYDDVMNKQREIIYGERRKVLEGVDTRDNILEYVHEVIAAGVAGHCQTRQSHDWDLDGLLEYLRNYFPLAEDTEIPEDALRGGIDGLTEYLYDAACLAYEAKESEIGDEELRRQVERFVMLRTIDQKWVDYLTQMEHFREGVGLQAYGQRDPLVEYKLEAHKMFDELTASIRADVVANMFRVQVMPSEPPPQAERVDASSPQGAAATGTVEGRNRRREPAAVGVAAGPQRIGRNDPCWCGSGRKYKRCHGR
ncbi:MAG: preprotein translocase subunit SecA [Candidatus Dormiibacterota bacterium]